VNSLHIRSIYRRVLAPSRNIGLPILVFMSDKRIKVLQTIRQGLLAIALVIVVSYG
jgi:hypothetical protein